MRSKKGTGAERRLAIASGIVTAPINIPRSLCESYVDPGSLSSVALVVLIRFYLSLFFPASQKVDDLPGVGWSLGKKLQTLGAETCADLQKFSCQALQKEFGPKTGLLLYQYCRGIDDRNLKTERERRSVSAEINYGIRFTKVRWDFV